MTDYNPVPEARKLFRTLEQGTFPVEKVPTDSDLTPYERARMALALAETSPDLNGFKDVLGNFLERGYRQTKTSARQGDTFTWFPDSGKLYQCGETHGDPWKFVEGDPLSRGLRYNGERRGSLGFQQAWR